MKIASILKLAPYFKPLASIFTTQPAVLPGYYTFFNSNLNVHRQIPYEIKEITMKNIFGILITGAMANFVPVLSPMMAWGPIIFGANWLFRSITTMWTSIVRADIANDGKSIVVTYKRGGQDKFLIKDIKKVNSENTLMETFVEPFLFPITINQNSKQKLYSFYGVGHGSIKNGPIFRSVINGDDVEPSKTSN